MADLVFGERPRRVALGLGVLAVLALAPGCTLSNLRSTAPTPPALPTASPTLAATPPVFPTAAPTLAATPTTEARLPATSTTIAVGSTPAVFPTLVLSGAASTSVPATAPATQAAAPVNGPLNEDEAVVKVVEKVSPAVVTVINTLDPQQNQGFSGEASGSGVIFDPRGYVVTNNHVVAGASALAVIFADGRKADATLVGADDISDLAVLKIDGALPAVATLGNSSTLRPGETVIAIGSALGDLHNTVTQGVISGLNRVLPGDNGVNMENMIQTDAAINHGNSGGPLLNLRGEVVGINTAVVRSSGMGDVAEGLGFSIPVDTVKTITAQLIASGKIARPYLGVQTRNVTRALAAYYNLRDQNGALLDHGVIVVQVTRNSPAAAAGLQPGDVILSINGQAITPDNSLTNVLIHFDVGAAVTLNVVRDGQPQDIPVTLGSR